MEYDQILKIKQTYNEAITMCYEDPHSDIASTNKTICGIEQIIDHPIAKRTRDINYFKYVDDDEDPVPMYKSMCGCRLTSFVIFVMLLLNISIPSGLKFQDTYEKLYSRVSPIIRKILDGPLLFRHIREIKSWQLLNIYIYPTLQSTSDIYIVNIYKYIEDLGSYHTMHSFIVRNILVDSKKLCEVISSWYSGADSPATPLIYNRFPFDELQVLLTPEYLLNHEVTTKLFGENNNFTPDSLLQPIFIAKEGIVDFQL